MSAAHPLTQRMFFRDLGRGAVAIAVVGIGVTACSDDENSGNTVTPASTSSAVAATPTTASAAASATATQSAGGASVGAVDWRRVALGSVSAYILVRGGEAAVLDTGVSGSGGAIEQALAVAGVD